MLLALIIFLGFISGPVALVHGVKKLEVIFVLALGYFLFGDKPTRGSWIAASVMIFGVVLIKLP
ncbi:hypothetical protein HY612_05915 [Candidatus Roizmanbacteria bacterium]|nr:hypothetical protein [Candidatus Roizmanbacteria bacterium]